MLSILDPKFYSTDLCVCLQADSRSSWLQELYKIWKWRVCTLWFFSSCLQSQLLELLSLVGGGQIPAQTQLDFNMSYIQSA